MSDEYEMSEEIRSLEQQLDCAAEFCRQYQIENKELKERVKELENQPAQEPARPDIIEKLSYHKFERDDLTLDDCLSYLRTNGWHEVHGRNERQLILQLSELLAAQPAQEPGDFYDQLRKIRTTHPDDLAVDKFAAAMKEKLEISRRVHGRGGWDNKGICSAERLQGLLLGHVTKGDPVDVGNFAMMLFNRGEQTKFPITSQPTQEPVLPDISALNRIAKELKTYIPEADEYKGKFIHKVWAKEIESALSPAPEVSQS